jgi:hypothetical protein
MTAHKGPVSSWPRCTRSGSSVAAIPIYHLPSVRSRLFTLLLRRNGKGKAVPLQAKRVDRGIALPFRDLGA